MATSLADATGAPTELVLNGETFRMSPFEQRDIAEFERYVRSIIIDLARDSYRDAPEEERRMALSAAFDSAARVHIGSAQARAQMQTPEGIYRLIWLALRREHPQLPLARVRELLATPGNLDLAASKLDEVNPRGKTPKKGMGDPAKANPTPA